MRERKDVLKELVEFEGDLVNLESELSRYPWDIEVPLLKVSITNLIDVLKKCLSKKISFDELINWANIIECRDDLDFETEKTKDLLFKLANPEINDINEHSLNDFLNCCICERN